MPWVRLDDNFFTHPKSVGLSTTAVTVFIRCICYASQHLTDGAVPMAAIESWGITRWRHAIDTLATRSLVTVSEDCLHVHDYLDYQRSAEEARNLSKKRASAGAKGGSKKAANAKQTSSNLLPSALAQHSTTEPSSSPPTAPVTEANGAASGGEEDDRQRFIEATLTATFELMADQTLDRVRAEGQAVHNPTAWKRATVANLTDEHRVAALHHIGDRTAGTYYDLHVEVAEALDPRCGPADGGAARAAAKRAATVAYLHPDHAA